MKKTVVDEISRTEINRIQHPELMIFSHIPKTAGTSLRHLIDNNYSENSIFYCYGNNPASKSMKELMNDLSQMMKTEDDRNQFKNSQTVKVLVGHIGFGVHDLLPPRSFRYITLLRDPVERIISYYSHVKKYFYNNLGNLAREKSLKDFIASRASIEVDNLQTRYISGEGWQRFTLGKGSQFKYGSCSNEMLELAKRNLRQYYIFGLQERFNQSLDIFSQYIGWDFIAEVKANVNENRKIKSYFDEETLNLVVEHNQLDYELYRYAKNLFVSGYLNQSNESTSHRL